MGVRIGGAFGLGQGTQQVSLSSGAVFYPPPGNYLVSMGYVTLLQYFDPITQDWRVYSWPLNPVPVPFQTDGYNWRLINWSGVMQGISITNVGSGATNGIGTAATGVTIGTGTAPTNGWPAAAYPIVGGAINTTITITAAGSGFQVPPQILIDPPPAGGNQATAVCTITAAGGGINAVTVTNAGAGYTSVPNIYLVPQWQQYPGGAQGGVASPFGVGGTQPPGLVDPSMIPPSGYLGSGYFSGPFTGAPTGGAKLTINATLAGSGTVTGIGMLNNGGNYLGTAIPSITFTGAGAAAGTAIMAFSVTALGTAGSAGTAYSIGGPWISTDGVLGASAGAPVNFFNNIVMVPRPARGVLRATTGFTGTAAGIEDPGFGFHLVPAIGTPISGTIPTAVSTTTAAVGGINDISMLQVA